MNRKGDMASILIVVIIIFILGVMLLVFSNLFEGIFAEFDTFFLENQEYNDSEAHNFLNEVQTYESSMWDYFFLALFIGYVLVLFLTSFSTPINAFFFWIYGLMSIFGLVLGTILSNVWQEIAANPELTSTIARFPITNIILGNFFPLFITVISATSMILLFGKANSGGER